MGPRQRATSELGRWLDAAAAKVGIDNPSELARRVPTSMANVSRWRSGGGISERWRLPLATVLRVPPDTVPIGIDAKPAEVAPGVTGARVPAQLQPSPMEGTSVDYGQLTTALVTGVLPDEQEKAYYAVRKALGLPLPAHPKARGRLSQRRRNRDPVAQ